MSKGNRETLHSVERVDSALLAYQIQQEWQKHPDRRPRIAESGAVSSVAGHMTEIFLDLHTRTHEGMHAMDVKVGDRAVRPEFLESLQREEIRLAFESFCIPLYEKESDRPKTTKETPAEHLHTLYHRLDKVCHLYDVEHAFGLFCKVLEHTDMAEQKFPYGIAFTRAHPQSDMKTRSAEAVTNPQERKWYPDIPTTEFIEPPGYDFDEMVAIKNPSADQLKHNRPTYMKIGGLKFAVHMVANPGFEPWGQAHFVLENGQLVNATQELRDQIHAYVMERKPIRDMRLPCEGDHSLADYIHPNGKDKDPHGKFAEAKEAIERLKISADACPYCLDLDRLTHLRMDPTPEGPTPLQQFKEFLTKNGYEGGFIGLMKAAHAAYPDSIEEGVQKELQKLSRAAARGTPYDQKLYEIAAPQLRHMLVEAWQATERAFEGKTGGQAKPQVYFPQGVSGSGKSQVKKIADTATGNNIVVASLDDGRSAARGKEGDIYLLNSATENHIMDYKNFTEFGELVRATMTWRAREGKYHLFMDGSGIPWEGKNETTARQMHEEGYDVHVVKTATPFFNGSETDDVTHRLGWRGVRDRRFVPVVDVVVVKAGKAEESKDRANKGRMGENGYIASTSTLDTAHGGWDVIHLQFQAELTRDQIMALDAICTDDQPDKGARARNFLKEEGVLPPHIGWDTRKLPAYEVARGMSGKTGTYLVDVIPDAEHYVRSRQTGLQCFHHPDHPQRPPTGPESLALHTLEFDVTGQYQTPQGRLNFVNGTQTPSPWPDYQRMCSHAPVRMVGTEMQRQMTELPDAEKLAQQRYDHSQQV